MDAKDGTSLAKKQAIELARHIGGASNGYRAACNLTCFMASKPRLRKASYSAALGV